MTTPARRSHYTNYKTQLNFFRQHSVQFLIQHLLWYLSDMDECSASIPACHASAQCLNTLGSFKCLCPAGFTGGLSTIYTGKPSSLKHRIRPCLIWVSVFLNIFLRRGTGEGVAGLLRQVIQYKYIFHWVHSYPYPHPYLFSSPVIGLSVKHTCPLSNPMAYFLALATSFALWSLIKA